MQEGGQDADQAGLAHPQSTAGKQQLHTAQAKGLELFHVAQWSRACPYSSLDGPLSRVRREYCDPLGMPATGMGGKSSAVNLSFLVSRDSARTDFCLMLQVLIFLKQNQ